MNDEDWERLKNSVRAQQPDENQQPDEKEPEERRKLNRDMDRLERVLKRVVAPDPQARERKREEDKRWQEFVRRSRERSAEISAFAARSDQKLKTLIDDIRNKQKP